MLTIHIAAFPVLETARLTLRQVQDEDAERLFELRNHPDVLRYLDRNADKDVAEVRDMIARLKQAFHSGNILWGMALRGTSELVGAISFWRMDYQNHRAEVGFLLDSKYWQLGLMYEALSAATEYGFREMKLHSVMADTSVRNVACHRLLLKSGFMQEAHFRENWYFNGQFLDSLIFCKLTDLK